MQTVLDAPDPDANNFGEFKVSTYGPAGQLNLNRWSLGESFFRGLERK
jgi:hypothetical protein